MLSAEDKAEITKLVQDAMDERFSSGLSTEDKAEIAKIVGEAMDERFSSGCQCGLSRASRQEMGHLMGRLRDIGEGSLNQGVEKFGEAIKSILRIKRSGERIGGAIAIFVAVTITGGVVTALMMGIKALIAQVKLPP